MVPLRVYFVTSLQGHELAACVSHYPFAFILTCCVDSKIIDTNWKYTWSNISSLKKYEYLNTESFYSQVLKRV